MEARRTELRGLAVGAVAASLVVLSVSALLPVPADTVRVSTLAFLPGLPHSTHGHRLHSGAWEVVPGVYEDDREPPGGPIHSALLPSGKVLLFTYNDTWLFDPLTRSFAGPLASPGVIVCAGMAMLGDGRLFVAGGFAGFDDHGRYTGPPTAQVFDPWGEAWTEVAPMRHNRWYPTVVTLPDGRAAVFTGTDGGDLKSAVEVFDPATGTWAIAGDRDIPLYARAHVIPDGTVLFTSPDRGTVRWDPGTGTFEAGPTRGDGYRRGGVSVLLDSARGTVLAYGGIGKSTTDPGFNATMRASEVLDPTTGRWLPTGDLAQGRLWGPGVLLPNGDVLAIGGEILPAPAAHAEWYEADTGQWVEMAKARYRRPYHSTGLLLADGSVLATGASPTMEVYKPWYFFAGPRPVIAEVPGQVDYGATFTVASPDAADVARATLVRIGSDTHNLNTDQRLVEAPIATSTEPGALHLQAPPSSAVAPPGYYLLFLFDGAGVPSEGAMVRVG